VRKKSLAALKGRIRERTGRTRGERSLFGILCLSHTMSLKEGPRYGWKEKNGAEAGA
jgi:hypothetical protein